MAPGILVAWAVALTACQSPPDPAPPEPPSVRIASKVFRGTPLSGPRALDQDVTAAEGEWLAHARFAFDPDAPPTALPLLSQSATLLADTGRSAPVRAFAASTAGARRGASTDLHDGLIWLGAVEQIVVAGGTTRLALDPEEGAGPLAALDFAPASAGQGYRSCTHRS